MINQLAQQLASIYGEGWSEKQLRHCLRFAEIFVDEQIVSALRRDLRLVAVELKIGDFVLSTRGRWSCICTGKKQEQIELLELDKSGIHVAEYLTVLPSREALQAKLYQSVEAARQRLAT